MPLFELKMPKLGESITQATIIRWFVKEGDYVKEDDSLLDIATDKVDSEIPSPVAGVITKIFFNENDVVSVGEIIALIDTSGSKDKVSAVSDESIVDSATEIKEVKNEKITSELKSSQAGKFSRFYSPLARQIIKNEKISFEELDKIQGSGINGRVTKKDILTYLETRNKVSAQTAAVSTGAGSSAADEIIKAPPLRPYEGDQIIEMDRIRKLTAEHMIRSKQVSAHVTNILEVDVTGIVNWRNKIKDEFEKREGVKLTYLPVIIEAAVKALKEFPLLNASVDGTIIILKKKINVGVAVALEDTNLIVPVIKNADLLNIPGLAKELNRLSGSARANSLKPDDIQDGTFTITNFGTFRNTIGTPIINQPQVAILGVGVIEKKPAVLETPDGDVIAIRHKMFLSLTYDHRIINGAYAGAWLRKVADYLESFDQNRKI